uniref:Ion transport domain-containing protein n=1 Tax=Romanomermis culicivorax TaxID=13658 RepID=A0A915KHL6_ROMCU
MIPCYPRWNDILSLYDIRIGCPIYRLIEHAPEVYKVILDKSLTTCENVHRVSKLSSDYWTLTYYCGTSRINYGLWVFSFNIILYLIFLASLTDSVLIWHCRLTFYQDLNPGNATMVSIHDLYNMILDSREDKVGNEKCRLLDFMTKRHMTCTMAILDSIGLYVVMFRQILKTILKVWVTFSVLFVAFGLTFYLLLSVECISPNPRPNPKPKPNHKVDFRFPFIAVFQSVLMMMGDYNYVENFARPYYERTLVYPLLTFGFLLAFVILMPILFINLLIGLAVGDIEIVQKDASLKRLAMQVEYHTELENRMPSSLLKKLEKREVVKYPNGKGADKGKLQYLFALIRKYCLSEYKNTENCNTGQTLSENDRFLEELQTTKASLNEMKQKMDRMTDVLQMVACKMGIGDIHK